MSYTTSPRTVTVTATASLLAAAHPNRAGRLFKNLGAASVFLGGADVTAAGALQGWELVAGAEFEDTVSNGNIYAIVAAGTCDVKVWELNA